MWLAEETKKNLPIELDFVNEGQNCERVARQLHHFDFLKVCEVHMHMHVLVFRQFSAHTASRDDLPTILSHLAQLAIS